MSKHKPIEGSDWEKEFSSSQFGKDCLASLPFIRYKQLKSFISYFLKTTRNEVLSEVEKGMDVLEATPAAARWSVGFNAHRSYVLSLLKTLKK